MLKIIKSDERHTADFGWLQTHWHFSFSDYHDPKNMHWSELRVFNDDVVQPDNGFDMHPHRDMEIVTYIIDGTLMHSDNLGHAEPLRKGEVQVMSAGTGILHSERNTDAKQPVHLIQLWIMPRHRGNTPRWEQRGFGISDRAGQLVPVVSSGNVPDTLAIDQDATIYIGRLKANQTIQHQNAGTHAYVFVIEGEIEINGQKISAGDQARMADERQISLKANKDAHVMLIDLP